MSTPTRRERFRPLELLSLSTGVDVFVGVVVLIASREFAVGVIFALLAFIVSLVLFAMLAITSKPTGDEQVDLDEQDRDAGH